MAHSPALLRLEGSADTPCLSADSANCGDSTRFPRHAACQKADKSCAPV